MHWSSHDYYKNDFGRLTGLAKLIGRSFCIALVMYAVALGQPQLAQSSAKPNVSSFCNYDSALEIIGQQLDATKTFNDTTQRIRVLVRAADLLWPYRQPKARRAFKEALDLAFLHFKDNGDQSNSDGVMSRVSSLDQRYVVIGAIARRDHAWAMKITEQILREDSKDAGEGANDFERQLRTATRLLDTALLLSSANPGGAVSLARRSLSYPATLGLPLFLYKLSEVNQSVADQFYLEALGSYGDKPLDQVLYLSAYPFGNDREAVDLPVTARYRIPIGFAPRPALQRAFLQMLLNRSSDTFEDPSETSASKTSDARQIWLALTRLERQVQGVLPDLIGPLEQTRAMLFAKLSRDSQHAVMRSVVNQNLPKRTFDEQIEAAQKQSDADERNRLLVFAVITASHGEKLAHVVDVIEKISDSTIRGQLTNWLYFGHTQNAIKDKQLNEAQKLALKVEELDQRAYLYAEIASELLKAIDNYAQAMSLLDEVVEAAAKAPITLATSRALLSTALLYTRLDMNRSVSVVGDAIKRINALPAPDFSSDVFIRKIEGKNFGAYATFKMPGANPENTLRELARLDFDSALYQTNSFADKQMRALTTLALTEPCLQILQNPPKNRITKQKSF